jgi:hypothetical protein
VRSLLGAIALWTALVFVALMVYPGIATVLPCMRLVGRTPACEAAQAVMNDLVIRYWLAPLLVSFAAGYAAIALVYLRGRSRQPVSKERFDRP